MQGWVQTSAFQLDVESNFLPIVEAPPTPIPPATSTSAPTQSKDKDEPNPVVPTEEKQPSATPYP
jgi:hypothetical protein